MFEKLERFEIRSRFPDLKEAPIYIVGEEHNNPLQKQIQFRMIAEAYGKGMRHLFLEDTFCMGLELNRWMRAEDDGIVKDMFSGPNWIAYSSSVEYQFLKAIKSRCVIVITGINHTTELQKQNLIRVLPDYLKVPFQVCDIFDTETGTIINQLPDDGEDHTDPGRVMPSEDNRYGIVSRYPDRKEARVLIMGDMYQDRVCKDAELYLIRGLYEKGMRHLFLDVSYCAALELNRWMKAEDDAILEELFEDARGQRFCSPEMYRFLLIIKKNLPDLVFHGYDVEDNRDTTGARVLERLRKEGLEDSEIYRDAQLFIEMGESCPVRIHGNLNGKRDNFMALQLSMLYDKLSEDAKKPRVLVIADAHQLLELPVPTLLTELPMYLEDPFDIVDILDHKTGKMINVPVIKGMNPHKSNGSKGKEE